MNRRTAFMAAMAVTLALVLCVGGAVLLHRSARQPEAYTGGTTGINFDDGTVHTAGDAVLIPAQTTASAADKDANRESSTDSGMSSDADDAEVSLADEQADSAVLLNERPNDVWAEDTTAPTNSGGYTTRAQLPAADSIGTLKIPSIGLTVDAYDSADTMEDMDKGVSHFSSTSYWDGNIGMAGHNGNRGYSYFGKLHKVKVGDSITYSTELGTRTYTVTNIWTIADDDWEHLERTEDNRLTLITCVSDPAKRLCVQAVEQ